MAIFHCSVKTVSRSSGRTSTAAAAYRSGSEIADERTGQVHDYSKKSDVAHSEIIGFSGSRSELWNGAEAAEKRKDATTAREYEIAIPKELDSKEKIALVQEYGQWINERHKVAVDLSIHDIEGENPHAHILTSTREVGPDGKLAEKAAREWSDTKRKKAGLPGRKADLNEARQQWGDRANKALELSGSKERIDHRSLADQKTTAFERGDQEKAIKLDREPTLKMGKQVSEMERRGIKTDRGDENRQIEKTNRERIAAKLAEFKVKAQEVVETVKKGFADLMKEQREAKAEPPKEKQRFEQAIAERREQKQTEKAAKPVKNKSKGWEIER